MKKRKPQIRSDKCALVTMGVSFNICDPEQAKDLEYADSIVNFSGDVKQWIRSRRLGLDVQQTNLYPVYYEQSYRQEEVVFSDFIELSEDDALNSLI